LTYGNRTLIEKLSNDDSKINRDKKQYFLAYEELKIKKLVVPFRNRLVMNAIGK
jgi:hypothetical protein